MCEGGRPIHIKWYGNKMDENACERRTGTKSEESEPMEVRERMYDEHSTGKFLRMG